MKFDDLYTNLCEKSDDPLGVELADAVEDKDEKKALELIKKGADVHTYDDSALQSASEFGLIKVVKALIKKGANINTVKGEPVRLAAKNGHFAIVKFLVSKKAILSDSGRPMSTLAFAAQNDDLKMVKFLVDNGADPHAEKDRTMEVAKGKSKKFLEEL